MITVFEVQAIKDAKKYNCESILLDWMLENYPDGFKVPTQIYSGCINHNNLIAEFEDGKAQDKSEFLRLNMHHDDVFIVMQPLGAGVAAGAIIKAIAVKIAIAVATAVIVNALFPPPSLPEGARLAKGSPNNGVGPQRNIARPLERTPDIFGKDRSTPDLITSGSFEFVDHIKFIDQYFVISRGFGLKEDLRSGETDFDLIVGSTKEYFEPGESPSELLKSRESNEVRALTLNPPNDSGALLTEQSILTHNVAGDSGVISLITKNSTPSSGWLSYAVGSFVSLEDIRGGTESVNLDGSYTVKSLNFSKLTNFSQKSYTLVGGVITISVDASVLIGSNSAFFQTDALRYQSTTVIVKKFISYEILSATSSELVLSVGGDDSDGLLTFGSIISDEIVLSDVAAKNENWLSVSDFTRTLIVGSRIFYPRVSKAGEDDTRGPFVIPGSKNSEVWIDIQFPRGLVNDADKEVTVDTRFSFEELDENLNPVGIFFDVNYSFSDNVPDSRYYTKKITTLNGLKLNTNYQVTGFRTSDTDVNDNTLLDLCQWTRLAGIEDISDADNTGTTRLKTRTQATEQTSALQVSRINLNWTRKTVTWDGLNVIGDIETGVGLTASKRFADSFLHYALDPKLGARNISQVDAEAIYEIQDERDSVDNGETGEFSFTFSSENMPALEELRQICNSSRCTLIRDGSVLSAVRDQANPISTQLFNRRNKIPDSERKTITLQKPLDVDGVTLEYKSDIDDEIKIINIPQDLEAGDPNFGNPAPLNALKVEGTGIRNKIQAWDRAQYEYNKIIYKRETVETTVTGEALLLNLNDRVDHVDGTRIQSKVSEGEVLGFSGFDVDTSELCEFDPMKTYSVIFRNIDGSLSISFPATQRVDTDFGFTLSSSPSLFLRGDNGFQRGSLYSFAADDAPSQSYLVQSISPTSEGNVILELVNYADEYYQADGILPPGVGRAYSDGYSDGYN